MNQPADKENAPALRRCSNKACGRELPATPEFFERNGKLNGGLSTRCRECRRAGYRSRAPSRQMRRRIQGQMESEQRQREETVLIVKELSRIVNTPHSGEVVESFFSKYGKDKYVDKLVAHFAALKPGSQMTIRTFEMMSRLIEKFGPGETNEENMTEDELKEQARRYLPQVLHLTDERPRQSE